MALRRVLPAPRARARADVSLAIVNIVLLLIFFFLATGGLLNSPSYGVDLSTTDELPIEMLPKPLLIVGPGGELSLNGEPLAIQLLGPKLIGETRVHLLIDRATPATDLVALLSQPELAAVEVRLVTIHLREEDGGS
ncbi:MAG: biopolymer transporter ExbD [Rhodobacteraceae bacterium]|nr:biopolymer transporter ExbD [Paracoccaceae bacterium]